MSKKLLQATLSLAMVSLAAYKDMFNEDLHMQQPESEPRPILKSWPKKEYCFVIKGKQIMATSRKDAIKKYNHKYK
mgnify:FL=1